MRSQPDRDVDAGMPRPAKIVVTHRGREVHAPRSGHLLGIFNEKDQLIIKRGDELVIVEVPTT